MHLGGNKSCKVLFPFNTAVTPFSARGLSPQIQKLWRTLVCNFLTTLFCFHCACMGGIIQSHFCSGTSWSLLSMVLTGCFPFNSFALCAKVTLYVYLGKET